MSDPVASQSCPGSAVLELNIPQLRNEMDVANACIYQQSEALRDIRTRLARPDEEMFKLQILLFCILAHEAVIYVVVVFCLL